MKFMSECTLQCNKPLELALPDVTYRHMVPHRITIVQVSGPTDKQVEEPARGIQCRIIANTELMNLSEPYFQNNNVISLTDNWAQVRSYGRIKLTLTSKNKDVRRYRVYSEYKETYGGVLYEDKVDKFDNVLTTIHERGRCSRINITCSKALKSLDFVTTFCCVEGDWIESFGASIDSDPSTIYSFDFTQGDLKEYVDLLKYMQLQITGSGSDDDLYVYITASGFPHIK
jgi:hypothetical protein